MARIGLGPDATPEQADLFLDQINKLFQELEKAKGFAARIKGIDRDAAQFAADVECPRQPGCPGARQEAPEVAAENLYTRLRAGPAGLPEAPVAHRADRERSQEAGGRRGDHAAAQLELDALCRDARCTSADELPAAEERSARRGSSSKPI